MGKTCFLLMLLVTSSLAADDNGKKEASVDAFLSSLDVKQDHSEHSDHAEHAEHAGHSEHAGHDEHAGHEDHANHASKSSHTEHDAHAGHMMKMWFHGGYTEVILFDFWRIDSASGMLVSCIIVFIMGVLYEALKYMRAAYKPPNRPLTSSEVPLNSTEKPNHCPSRNQTAQNENTEIGIAIRSPQLSKRQVLVHRLFLGLLYVLQLTLAYWLMLIVMTYNTYLTVAVIFGAGFGVFLFNTLLPGDFDTSDACH